MPNQMINIMFKDTKTFSSFSVNDVQKAKDFYSNTLGLDVTQMPEMGDILDIALAGGYHVIAYPKPNHTPATFTILNFSVTDVEKAVTDLKAKGVVFESYDSEYLKTDEDNIARGGGPLIAWFKDPAGNILSVMQDK
ncbi:MAG: VOC family protein [Mucilaginibacter sp.]